VGHALVIRGGTVVDGTGEPARRADVGIRDGRVAEIGGRLDGETELDADGAIVVPGFVDVHTHYDAQVFWDPWLTPSDGLGVTTVVAGNCGVSLAPCPEAARELMLETLRYVEDMESETLRQGVDWSWESFPEYLDRIATRGLCQEHADEAAMRDFVACVENHEALVAGLEERGLVAFVGDGSVLPRESGASDRPLEQGVVPLEAPEALAVEIEVPHAVRPFPDAEPARRLRGLGVPRGVTLIVGGGYHGKSTLLDALMRSIRAAERSVGVVAVAPSSRRTSSRAWRSRPPMRPLALATAVKIATCSTTPSPICSG